MPRNAVALQVESNRQAALILQLSQATLDAQADLARGHGALGIPGEATDSMIPSSRPVSRRRLNRRISSTRAL